MPAIAGKRREARGYHRAVDSYRGKAVTGGRLGLRSPPSARGRSGVGGPPPSLPPRAGPARGTRRYDLASARRANSQRPRPPGRGGASVLGHRQRPGRWDLRDSVRSVLSEPPPEKSGCLPEPKSSAPAASLRDRLRRHLTEPVQRGGRATTSIRKGSGRIPPLAEIHRTWPSLHSDVRLVVVRGRRAGRRQCRYVRRPGSDTDRRQPSGSAALDRVACQRTAERQGTGVFRIAACHR
jgi:hypothetical protein